MNHYMATTNFVHPGGAGFKKDQVYEMDEAEGRKLVAGGMMRDVLAGEIPLVFRRELYATAGMAAALSYLVARAIGLASVPAMVAGVIVGLALRLAALRWNLGLPVYRTRS